MLNHLAAAIACGRTKGGPQAAHLLMGSAESAVGSRRPAVDRRMCHLPFWVENLLNVGYRKYMCCSTATGFGVPRPGIMFKSASCLKDRSPSATA